jgi:hypothetical protein
MTETKPPTSQDWADAALWNSYKSSLAHAEKVARQDAIEECAKLLESVGLPHSAAELRKAFPGFTSV